VWVFLTTMPCHPHAWMSHAGSPTGSMAVMAVETTGESGNKAGYGRARKTQCQKKLPRLGS